MITPSHALDIFHGVHVATDSEEEAMKAVLEEAAEHFRDATKMIRAPLPQGQDKLREALKEARAWHENADKVLSKSGRKDKDCLWMRHQHQEQIEVITDALASTPCVNAEAEGEPVEIDYTNWRGERAIRRILPIRIFFGSNEWHPVPQLLIEAMDVEKGALRTFAVGGIAAPRDPREAK